MDPLPAPLASVHWGRTDTWFSLGQPNSLLLKSWIWTLNDIGGWEEWLLLILWVQNKANQKGDWTSAACGSWGGREQSSGSDFELMVSAPREAWPHTACSPRDLCVSARRFSSLPKLNDWVLLLEIKVFLIKVHVVWTGYLQIVKASMASYSWCSWGCITWIRLFVKLITPV